MAAATAPCAMRVYVDRGIVVGVAVKCAAMMASLRATFGHWKHASTWRLRLRTLRRIGLDDDPMWWTHDAREL